MSKKKKKLAFFFNLPSYSLGSMSPVSINTSPQPFKAALNYCLQWYEGEWPSKSRWTEIEAGETSAGCLEVWDPQNNKIPWYGV